VFPELVRDKSPDSPIRIWVPGCSSGQEVYSIAIALTEYLESVDLRRSIQIFGTDLSDSAAIEKARHGLYPESIVGDVSAERLIRFLPRRSTDTGLVEVFATSAFLRNRTLKLDPPFSRMDLISCRNLLIYLSSTLQKRVIPAFHYSLNENGFLLLDLQSGGDLRICFN